LGQSSNAMNLVAALVPSLIRRARPVMRFIEVPRSASDDHRSPLLPRVTLNFGAPSLPGVSPTRRGQLRGAALLPVLAPASE
jgi:hypothetical protein